MDENLKSDLRIDGSGSASGGQYNSVRINGTGKVNGDISCNEFTINGSGEVVGNVESENVRINGSGNIKGSVKTTKLRVNGSANFESGVSAENITISGSTDVGKNLNAQQIKINGSVKVDGDCSAEKFHSNGLFEIGGLLNADDVEIDLYWHRSRAREIGGERITVSLGTNKFGVLKAIFSLGIHNPSLETDSIEGDEITIENTTAKVVRGNNVTIGNGCNISLVEYKGTYKKTGDAIVAEERKI